MHRFPRYLFLSTILVLFGVAAPAKAGVPERWQDSLETAERTVEQAVEELRAKAEQAILLGGALLYENRHAVAGAVLGCAAGSVVGVGSTAALAPVTGGAALAGTGSAALIGCGAGAFVGARIGYPLDHVFEEE